MGIPDFLLLDNALSFRGSNRYPRSPGLVIRMCLYYGVQPVFIPIAEPWRNGVIESFNNTYNKKFFRRQWFPCYAALKKQSKNFQQFHNKHHRYSCLKGKTPYEHIKQEYYQAVKLEKNERLPQLDFIPDGNITLIRFVRSDRQLDIFGEKFMLPKKLVYSYVKAVIVTEIHKLQVYLGNDLVKTFDYRLPTDY
ncbi:integrase core domain-containing protein [Thermodesulfobacteriota bacterium]